MKKKLSKTAKSRPLAKHNVNGSYLKELEITITDKGFTVWTFDRVKGTDGKIRKLRHWVMDASCLKEDGIMRLGSPEMYKTEARIDLESNHVKISRKR